MILVSAIVLFSYCSFTMTCLLPGVDRATIKEEREIKAGGQREATEGSWLFVSSPDSPSRQQLLHEEDKWDSEVDSREDHWFVCFYAESIFVHTHTHHFSFSVVPPSRIAPLFASGSSPATASGPTHNLFLP